MWYIYFSTRRTTKPIDCDARYNEKRKRDFLGPAQLLTGGDAAKFKKNERSKDPSLGFPGVDLLISFFL